MVAAAQTHAPRRVSIHWRGKKRLFKQLQRLRELFPGGRDWHHSFLGCPPWLLIAHVCTCNACDQQEVNSTGRSITNACSPLDINMKHGEDKYRLPKKLQEQLIKATQPFSLATGYPLRPTKHKTPQTGQPQPVDPSYNRRAWSTSVLQIDKRLFSPFRPSCESLFLFHLG